MNIPVFRIPRHWLAYIFISFFSSVVMAQQKPIIEPRNFKYDDFPTVTGKLWVRNPDGINTQEVTFFEDEKKNPLAVKFKNPEVQKDTGIRKKAIVFLVLNPGFSHNSELQWYKSVLKAAVNTPGVINSGDQVTVLNYNNETNGQLLFPGKPVFTEKKDSLIKYIDNITLRRAQCLCAPGTGRNLTYQALNQALLFLSQQQPNNPACIVVLTDDNCCFPSASGETVGMRSRRLDIPIFGIIYPGSLNKINSIRSLCEESFGSYFESPGPGIEAAGKRIASVLSSFTKRQSGVLYPFSYKSEIERDGKNHTLTVSYKGERNTVRLDLPGPGLIGWIKLNKATSILTIVILALVVYTIIRFAKIQKNKSRKQEEIARQKEEALLMKQRDLEDQLLINKQRMNQFADDQQKSILLERQKKEEENKRDELRRLEKEMYQHNEFPKLIYKLPNNTGSHSFMIKKPIILAGRSQECDISIHIPTISKIHFQIHYAGQNRFFIENKSTTNQTYLNRKIIQDKVMLSNNDVIDAGGVIFNFFI